MSGRFGLVMALMLMAMVGAALVGNVAYVSTIDTQEEDSGSVDLSGVTISVARPPVADKVSVADSSVGDVRESEHEANTDVGDYGSGSCDYELSPRYVEVAPGGRVRFETDMDDAEWYAEMGTIDSRGRYIAPGYLGGGPYRYDEVRVSDGRCSLRAKVKVMATFVDKVEISIDEEDVRAGFNTPIYVVLKDVYGNPVEGEPVVVGIEKGDGYLLWEDDSGRVVEAKTNEKGVVTVVFHPNDFGDYVFIVKVDGKVYEKKVKAYLENVPIIVQPGNLEEGSESSDSSSHGGHHTSNSKEEETEEVSESQEEAPEEVGESSAEASESEEVSPAEATAHAMTYTVKYPKRAKVGDEVVLWIYKDGQPVDGVKVEVLSPGGESQTMESAGGRVSFEAGEEGEYQVRIGDKTLRVTVLAEEANAEAPEEESGLGVIGAIVGKDAAMTMAGVVLLLIVGIIVAAAAYYFMGKGDEYGEDEEDLEE